MSVQAESPPTASLARRSGAGCAPLVDALERYRALRIVPFSGPGHKLGAGAPDELVSLLGPELFAADVWLDTGTGGRALQQAEALAAAAWGADRSFFLANGSSCGNHAFLLGAVAPGG